MNASKETARDAKQDLAQAVEMLDLLVPGDEDRRELKRYLIRVQDFIEVAERKLPTDAAYQRDAKRRRTKAQAK